MEVRAPEPFWKQSTSRPDGQLF